MNLKILETCGLKKEVDLLKKGKCPFCGTVPGPFRDRLSEKEFQISGLCQKCQDDFFVE